MYAEDSNADFMAKLPPGTYSKALNYMVGLVAEQLTPEQLISELAEINAEKKAARQQAREIALVSA